MTAPTRPPGTAADALALVSRVTGRIAVALSGGKDSLATLDVAVRALGKERVACFFMYVVEGLDCEMRAIRGASRRHDVEVLTVPHWSLSAYHKGELFRPPSLAAQSTRNLRMTDVEGYVRRELGAEWIAYGERASDSILRNAKLKRCAGFDEKTRRIYPIWRWNKAEVLAYLRARKIPVPQMIGGGTFSSGITWDGRCLDWLETHFPQDLAKVEAKFPFVRAELLRWRAAERAKKERCHGEGDEAANR